MGMRRKGREIALKVLYSIEYNDNVSEHEINNFKEKLQEITADSELDEDGNIYHFAEKILSTVAANIDEIDLKIQQHSTNWAFNQIAILDKSILRIAIGEMLFSNTAPPIIMNEATEISKK